MPNRPPITRLIEFLLAFTRLSVERRAVARSVRALGKHKRWMAKRRGELRAIEKRLSLVAERVAADIARWNEDKKATEGAMELLEQKLNVLELANKTLVATHAKLVETQKAEIAVQKTRQAIAAPREEQ